MNDTTAMVTGAGSGIGAAVARTLGRAGATVVACTHDGDVLQSVVNDIERGGGSASTARAGVRDKPDMRYLVEMVARAGGRIDVLVANTTIAHGTPGEMPAPRDSYTAPDGTLKTNVRSVFAAVKEALPYMADGGRILVPSGSVAREVKPEMGAYAVSKAATEALVRQLAADCDWAVTVVDPGLVTADLTGERGRNPDDAADLFVWVVTDVNPAELDGDTADLKAWKRATH